MTYCQSNKKKSMTKCLSQSKFKVNVKMLLDVFERIFITDYYKFLYRIYGFKTNVKYFLLINYFSQLNNSLQLLQNVCALPFVA